MYTWNFLKRRFILEKGKNIYIYINICLNLIGISPSKTKNKNTFSPFIGKNQFKSVFAGIISSSVMCSFVQYDLLVSLVIKIFLDITMLKRGQHDCYYFDNKGFVSPA